MSLAPVAPRERIVTLDVLRGFALLGVLIGNSYWLYSARAWERPPDTTRLDSIAHWFVALFVESKAQTLLTFLFGFGFAAQLLRAEERNEPVMGVYLRRLVVLLTIGVLHVMLWWGDVTWTYAVAGFGLLLFLRASDRACVIWAMVLTFIPAAIGAFPSVRSAAAGLLANPSDLTRARQTFLTAIHVKRFWPVVSAHLHFALVYQAPFYFSYYPWLVGRFLLGYVAGRQRWFEDDGARHLPLFRKLVLYGLVADVPGVALTIVFRSGVLAGHKLGTAAHLAFAVIEQLGSLGLTAAYVGTVVLLMQRRSWRRLLTLIAPAGRMPLTTYISQSVICTFLYYGWGLGWAGRARSAPCVALAFAIFALQVAVCHLWLRRFRFGPLEWVWRTLVYLRRPPMRA
ncbi:MAG: hypothetical protein JWN44_5936 [Myxococcales bacterium]|nr:hypothetical protein [Myxococcales bacterium]